MNLFRIGEQLLFQQMDQSFAHSVSMRRGDTTVGPFAASSPPVGHELLTDTGIDFSEHNRDFYFVSAYTGILGPPQIGDVIVDHADKSEWKVLPQGDGYAWNWHGQMRDAYHVMTKQDNVGTKDQ